MRHSRAQAAMEFLMTYGWAVLILMVVIAILYYLGVFSPSPPRSCVFPAGFTCYEFEVYQNGSLYLDVGQATGKMVTVTAVGCGVTGDIRWTTVNDVVVRSGTHANVTGLAGAPCGGASASSFRGSAILNYTVSGSGLTARSVTGSVSAPVTVVSTDGGSGGGGSQQGWIFGYVNSSVTGAPLQYTAISNASFTLYNDSDASGNYVIYGLAPGTYTIRATWQGCKGGTPALPSVVVSSGSGTEQNFTVYTGGPVCP